MVQKKKIKLKKPAVILLRIFGSILVIVLVAFFFYFYQINTLCELGYSKVASKNILFSWKKDYVMSIGENKTLNAAFESDDYLEKYLENYANIKYQNHKNLIKNINLLLKKGYSNSNISMILAHGSDTDVFEFAKRDKVRYLEEFYSLDYAKLSYYDRYLHYSDETGEDEETTVLFVNLDMDKNDYEDALVVKEFSSDMLVNKHRKLTEKFEPKDLVKIDSKYASDDMKASKVAIEAFKKMASDASKDGLGIVINSSYRSYQDQVDICNSYKDLYGEGYVQKYVAQPGYSEHQTGLAFDIGSTSSKIFAQSKEYEWMQENAYKYGFILRFPKKYESITGFRSEPWHYRYVGKKIANYIHSENITLEEYYVKFLDK